MKRTTLLAASIAMILGTMTHGETERRGLSAPRTEKAPIIDGALDDKCWESAEKIDEFFVYKKDEKTADTRIFLARDEQWLYIGFECGNENMAKVEQKVFDHGGSVQNDDSIEVFLDPGTGGEIYYHYKLSFGNVRAEIKVSSDKGKERGWQIPWKSATEVTSKGWTAEIAIPLYVLLGNGDLNKVRFNIARNKVNPVFDTMGVKIDQKRAWSTLSKVDRRFQEPENFVDLRGLDKGKITAPFLPGVETAGVGKYEIDGDDKRYPVECKIRNFTSKPGELTIEIIDKPPAGKENVVRKEIGLASREVTNVNINVPVDSVMERTVAVRVVDRKTGEVLEELNIADTSPLKMMAVPFLDRNYYTTEKNARLKCRFGFPPELLKSLALSAKKGEKTLASKKGVQQETILDIPLEALPAGDHQITMILSGEKGETLVRNSVSLAKKKPKPGCEVKIDQFNLVALKNGKPFFPFGIIYYKSGGQRDIEKDIKYIADTGFNFIYYWGDWGVKKFMDCAVKNHLDAGGGAWFFGKEKWRRPVKENLPLIEKGINIVKEYPNWITYQTVDEPNHGDYDRRMEGAILLYKTINKLDGYHPVNILYARYIPEVEKACKWCEIILYDVYIWAGKTEFAGSLDWMSIEAVELAKRACKERFVPWMVPSSGFLNLARTPRPLLRGEQMAQTYLAIIHGMKGLVYFHSGTVVHSENWKTFSDLAKQIKALEPALLTPDIPQKLAYSPVDFIPEKKQVPDVQASLRKYPDGRYVLLAANAREYPCEATFAIFGLPADGAVKRLFSKATIEVADGGFSETIEGFGTRAYDLGKINLTELPVSIRVDIKSLADTVTLEKKFTDRLFRKGAKNSMPNPDLEETYLPHWPKFFVPYRLLMAGIGSPECDVWRLDKDNPKFGAHSLRLKRDKKKCFGVFVGSVPPFVDRPTPYVLSFYMRADKDDVKVNFHGQTLGFKSQNFKVGKEWKRYTVADMLKPMRHNYRVRSFLLQPLEEGVTIWLDGFQLEPGVEPTKFTTE